VNGFSGYAFCKAHSTAYGVEAFQAAWLKKNYQAEFMAAVLSNEKGFYQPLVYVLESLRLGLKFSPPSVNEPGPAFVPNGKSIRVPVTRTKGLSERTREKIISERAKSSFISLRDFYLRVLPMPEEMEAMICVGAFDEFGQARTGQFWEAKFVQSSFQAQTNQGWLLPPRIERMPEVP
jgi:error-prone DNA polymerase